VVGAVRVDRAVLCEAGQWPAAGRSRTDAAHLFSGRPVEIRDVQIAGIATACKATLATRNIRHFENLGIILIDPWRA
jgi:predicted nucleic acid-binding protein